MVKIAVVHYSKNGHTAIIAQNVIEGARSQSPDVTVDEYTLENCDLEAITKADAIIFGCPTYFGAVPGEYKKFLDSTSDLWVKGLWRNKVAAAFSDSSGLSGDKLATLMQLNIFALQHGMIWVGLDIPPNSGPDGDLNRLGSWLGMMSQSSSRLPIEESPPPADRKTAQYFGARVASITKMIYNNKSSNTEV